eukprot:3819384-Prymnesium_polylepis.1
MGTRSGGAWWRRCLLDLIGERAQVERRERLERLVQLLLGRKPRRALHVWNRRVARIPRRDQHQLRALRRRGGCRRRGRDGC